MIGGLAIVGTFLILRIASEFGSISIFALNLTTALGLGLAIDYSLFIVSRYREEIAKDGPGLAAMRRVLATAGRTVFFSSLTVAAALASLLVFPQRFLYSMGLGGALVALFAALISLTVLPAVLTLLGTRVNALAPRFLQRRAEADTRPDESGFWYRLSRFVMRRPVPVATLSAAAADRHGHALLQHQVQHRRPDRAAELGQRPPGLRHGQQRIPALPRNADLGRRRRRRAEGGRARSPPRCAGSPGVAEVNPPQRLKGGVTALQVVSSQPLRLRGQPDDGEADPRPATAARDDGAGRRRHRRLHRPAVRASPATCRSCSGSSSSRP